MIYEYKYSNRVDLIEFIPENYSKVLEIGCGNAEFKKNLKKEIEYWCVEYSQSALDKIPNNIKKIKVKYEDNIKNLPDNYFDLIICNDVIEHMNDHDFF